MELQPKEAKFDRLKMEDLLKQKFFYDIAFSIYGGMLWMKPKILTPTTVETMRTVIFKEFFVDLIECIYLYLPLQLSHTIIDSQISM